MAQLLTTASMTEILASLTAIEGINQKQTGIIVTPTGADQPVPMGFYDGTTGSGTVKSGLLTSCPTESRTIDTGETISINDLVEVLPNGNCRKLRRFDAIFSSLLGVNGNGVGSRVCKLDNTHALVVWAYTPSGVDSYAVYASVLTVTNTTVSLGASLSCDTSYKDTVTISQISATQVLCVSGASQSTTAGMNAYVLTISGTTISKGSPLSVNTYCTYNDLAMINSTTYLLTYSISTQSYSVILSVSGTTVSKGTPINIETSQTYLMSSCIVSSTLGLVAITNTSNFYCTVYSVSISGTTLTKVTTLNCSNSSSSVCNNVRPISTTLAIVMVKPFIFTLINISGNTLTVNAMEVNYSTIFNAPINNSQCRLLEPVNGKYVVIGINNNNMPVQMASFTVSGTSLLFSPLVCTPSIAPNGFPYACSMTDGNIMALTVNGTTVSAQYFALRNAPNGVAKTAGTAGQSITMATFG